MWTVIPTQEGPRIIDTDTGRTICTVSINGDIRRAQTRAVMMANSREFHSLLHEAVLHLRKNCEGVFELEEFVQNVEAFLKENPISKGD